MNLLWTHSRHLQHPAKAMCHVHHKFGSKMGGEGDGRAGRWEGREIMDESIVYGRLEFLVLLLDDNSHSLYQSVLCISFHRAYLLLN